MHEIITVQLGQRSNYVATHFWNTQESYFTYGDDRETIVDHDIHFRPGIGADGMETFTPRTLIYDLKGGFGSLRKINTLYDLEEPKSLQALWNKPAIIQRQSVIEKCQFQQSLEEGLEPTPITSDAVRFWSDFNRVFYHPKSIIQINEYELNSTLMPFKTWNVGEELFQSLDKEYDLIERDIRPFVEESDQMQAIQMIASIDDAWGGFSARYLDHIKDEYGKTAIVFWGLEEDISALPREERFVHLSNTARSISEISPQTSLFVPVTTPTVKLPSYVNLDKSSKWQISALYSLAIESMTLTTRLKPSNGYRETMDCFAHLLNTNGHQNISRLQMSVDQNCLLSPSENNTAALMGDSDQSRDEISSNQKNCDHHIVAEYESGLQVFDIDFLPIGINKQITRKPVKKTHVFSQVVGHRKVVCPENHKLIEDSIVEQTNYDAVNRKIVKKSVQFLQVLFFSISVHKLSFSDSLNSLLTHLSRIITPLPFPLLDSFPRIFTQSHKPCLAVSTSLSVDTAVSLRLKGLQIIVNRAVGVDERESLSNSIGELAEAYEEGWDSGSDEGEDY